MFSEFLFKANSIKMDKMKIEIELYNIILEANLFAKTQCLSDFLDIGVLYPYIPFIDFG